jgi:hypothetical protein
MWAEEADHVKKMIKEKEGDIQVRLLRRILIFFNYS